MATDSLGTDGVQSKNSRFEELQAIRNLYQERAHMVAARQNSLPPSMFGFGFNNSNNTFNSTAGFQA